MAVTHSAETRSTIDLLTASSQHTNTKVRILAQDLIDHFATAPGDGTTTASRVNAFFHIAQRADRTESG